MNILKTSSTDDGFLNQIHLRSGIHRYLDLPVSLPPMEIQAKIVADVQSLQSQATALRQQALQKLDAAKAQVEHLIFGSD